jgi:PTS system nitrogen regulatory IIA component
MLAASSPSELEAFLTTEEVLRYLKVTPRTIYRLIRAGELPAVRIGRQWRFRRTDLNEWLDRQRATVS